MTEMELHDIIGSIDIHLFDDDWWFEVMDKGDGFLIQIHFFAMDVDTGTREEQTGRKWYVSSHACLAETVRTCWKALMAALEHEAAEKFLYKGVNIYGPHFSPDDLADRISERDIDLNVREE